MKKNMMTVVAFLLVLVMLAGCGKTETQGAGTPTAAPNTDTVGSAATQPITETPDQTLSEETEEDAEYEGDASSYYIDVVYAEQIRRYYTALSQKWDQNAYLENEMSPLSANYHDGNPLDNVGFAFMDLDGDGIWELIIGAIKNAEQDPLVFEIWTRKDDAPVLVAQSDNHNRYYLQYSQEDELWSVAYEAENSAENHAFYYLQLMDGEFQVSQGVIFDAAADEKAPWFMTYDLDWDVSNDTPVDEKTADAVMNAGRKLYTPAEYFPYGLYN